jgi:formylglycine-generating enzyme required for sulfatase activity
MVVIPGPVEFVMGSPPNEAGRESRESQHKKRIGRTFALAAKSVTLAEYQRFDPGYGGEIRQWSPTGNCPVLGISWFQAAEYCNWLSKQEGLSESEWCYVPVRDPGRTNPEYKVGMKLAANYLKRSGYRLPTEAEMEFATRAGSVTSRCYGETEELLPKYAWYNKNGQDRAWPVGSKKPNDLGLFDVHGNVFTWCQERFKAYPNSKENEGADDNEDTRTINSRKPWAAWRLVRRLPVDRALCLSARRCADVSERRGRWVASGEDFTALTTLQPYPLPPKGHRATALKAIPAAGLRGQPVRGWTVPLPTVILVQDLLRADRCHSGARLPRCTGGSGDDPDRRAASISRWCAS